MTAQTSRPFNLEWPLMENNIQREDLDKLIDFLKGNPRLTQSEQVTQFEQEWSEWVGVKHSVFVNSGSSANLITLAVLRELYGLGEIIVPTLTWVSDIAAVLHSGFKPVFVDIDPHHLGMAEKEIEQKITSNTKAVFLTHILGFNALSQKMLDFLKAKNIPLIEDACESHGATFKGQKIGSFGWASNFSFYYAHHLSTIEGGMVCTNDEKAYQLFRMCRSHGLVRESTSSDLRKNYASQCPDLNPEFIFAFPAHNVRSTEINAVLGRNQLKRLDTDVQKRNENFKLFLKHLDSNYYRTDFRIEGMSNYAFVLILREANVNLFDRVMKTLTEAGVEFRKGTSGGGNQLRQPYLKKKFGNYYEQFPHVEHVHSYGLYIGNYPELNRDKIIKLAELLNRAAK